MAALKTMFIPLCLVCLSLNAGTSVWNYNPLLINPTGYDSPSCNLDIGDVDGDGRADLAVNEDNSSIVLYRNIGASGLPRFLRMQEWDVPWEYRYEHNSRAPKLVDLDGDGRCELFMNDHVYRGVPDGGGLTWVNADNMWSVPLGLAKTTYLFADINGDGAVDVFGGREGQSGFHINEGDARNPVWGGKFVPVDVEPGRGWGMPRLWEMGDYDGDSRLDLLVTIEIPISSSAIEWYELTQVGDSLRFKYQGFASDYDWHAALGDIDGNDMPDMLGGGFFPPYQWYEKSGRDAFPVPKQLFGPPRGYLESGICLTEETADSKPALFILHPSYPSDVWNPFLVPEMHRWQDDSRGYGFSADLYDLLLEMPRPVIRPSVHQRPVDGWPDTARLQWMVSAQTGDSEWGREIDGIKRADQTVLFTLRREHGNWRHEGAIMDTTQFQLMPADSAYQDPIEADLNSDGYPELLLQRNGVYRVFPERDWTWNDIIQEMDYIYIHRIDSAMSIGIGDSTFYRADVKDLTGDGRPDLIIGKWDGSLTFFENLGPESPVFWREDTTLFSGVRVRKGPAVPALADLDGDGDPDLVVADGEGMLYSYSNDSTAVIWAVKDRSRPSDFILFPNYPNPFNSGTEVRFSLRVQEKIRIEVVDVLGRRIGILKDGRLEAGAHTVRWNGMDDSGIPVPSGLYFVRLSSAVSAVVRKMTVIR